MTKLKRVCAWVLLFSMMIAYFPADQIEVHAAEDIGTLNGRSYDDFDDLRDDLEDDYKNKPVTIEMKTNWDAEDDSDFDERIIIPSGCTATLNMNGYVFDRDNTKDNDWSYNGELICMESGSTLTVNGGKELRPHDVHVYSSTSRDSKASSWLHFEGGGLANGASTGGAGGIHVKSDCTVTLNNVTLAGCRAEAPWYDMAGTNSAYGGGIWLTGGNSNLRLNNSTITGCFAYYDGGGIFQSNHNYVNIEMNNSHVDKNYAADEGGGIDVDGEYIHISGTNGSTISGNKSSTAGGGIYIWNDDTSLTGFTIENNESNIGGGVYTKEATISLSKLIVRKNSASKNGGGIYINNKGNSIASCEITENKASGSGAGVYVNENVKDSFKVTGKTIIRENQGHNLYISDNDPDDSKVAFNLTKGSDVHFQYYDTENRDAIMVNQEGDKYKDVNCIQFLTADNSGYHFTYNSKPNSRKIWYVKDGKDNVDEYGEVEQKPNDPVVVKAEDANDASHKTAADNSVEAGVIGRVNAGGEKSAGGDYDLVRGFYTHEKTDSGTEDTESPFYYSDAFFDDSVDPKIYNEHLATASWVLAFAGTYLRKFDEEDGNGNTYYNKHAGARQFFADIGCPDQNIYVNESMQNKPGLDSIGVTIGSKELAKTGDRKTGKILIPVAVRGGGYEAEWASNVTLGKAAVDKDNEAQGFAEAANEVTREIGDYIREHDLEDEKEEGKLVFWISGFSRAGATANLTAKRLVESYACDEDGKRNKVFAYPCEAPKGGTDAAEKKTADKYFCIHNMINAIDIVPLVATTQMGCKRYGVDHYIPGTAKYTYKADQTEDKDRYDDGEYFADGRRREETVTLSGDRRIKKTVTDVSHGGVHGPNSVTTYRDNDIRFQSNFLDGNESGSAEANEYYKKGMLPQLKAIDSGIVYDNYFHPMTMEFIPREMKEYGYYKGNHIEFFVQDFIRLLQEGNNSDDWSKAVKSRDYWVDNLQPVMRDTMSLVFKMSGDDSAGFVGRASSIMDKISYVGGEVSMWEIYRNVLGEWNELSQSDKDKYTTFLLKKLKETGAFDYLSSEDAAKLESNWPALADFIFHITDLDYNYKPLGSGSSLTKLWGQGDESKEKDVKMALVPTFATFSSFVLLNHAPEVNIAWTRSYDSYYENEKTEYEVGKWTGSLDKPLLTVKDGSGKTIELTEGENETNTVSGDQDLIFDVEDIVGEAIYYDVKKIQGSNTRSIAKNKLHQYGDSLEADENQKSTSYTVTAYAMSYNTKSAKAVYNITINNDKHKISVNDLKTDTPDGSVNTYDLTVREGNDVKINAGVPQNKIFRSWRAALLDAEGNPVQEDIADDLLGESRTNAAAAFTMPKTGDKAGSGDSQYTYPDGYMIRLEAVYGDRIKEVSSSPDQPEAGKELARTALVEFDNGAESGEYPVSWSYTYTKDGEQKTVQTSGKALDATVYTAAIHVPQAAEGDILFGKTVTGTSDTGENVEVVKDASDGSVTIYMTMLVTDDTGINPRPDTDISITVKARDLNRPEDDPYDPDPKSTIDVDVYKNEEFVLTAPEVSGERFMQWNFRGADSGDDPDVILSDGFSKTDRTIRLRLNENISTTSYLFEAEYIPVISEIEVSLGAPEGGKKMPEDPVVNVKIANTYEVDPEFVHLSWAPAPTGPDEELIADYMIPYTATVTVLPEENADGETYIRAKLVKDEEGNPVSGQDYGETSAIFFYSDDLNVTMNGNDAAYDVSRNSLSYMFPATVHTLASVKKPADIVEVPHGESADGIKTLLPDKTKITTVSGASFAAGITWDAPVPPETDDDRKEKVWTVHGSVVLPDGVTDPGDVDNTSFDIKVTVKEAGYITTPAATLASGEYLYDQTTLLDRVDEDGYTTYYTTDGSDPKTSETRQIYKGGEIPIRREDADADNNVIIKAYTVINDESLWDSQTATYMYTFTNSVALPSAQDIAYNGESQIGISASDFYTLTCEEGSGAVIDERGNATAVEPGRYTVTAKIKEGFKWKIPADDTSDEYTETTEDQPVEFLVKAIDIRGAKIAKIKNRTYTGKNQKPSLKVTMNGSTLKAGTDYKAVYSKNKKVGTAKVMIAGIGHYTGFSDYRSFKILPKRAAIKKVKAGKRKATVTFKVKPSKTGGNRYQIRYRIKGKGKWKTKTTSKSKLVLKKLKKGKRYQIKVRAYRKVGKTKYYGKYSKTKVTKKIR